MKLYNSETRQKEAVIPSDGKKIRLYTCGPTIYAFAHIGNFRTYVFEDLLRRSLQWFGFSVEQAMNLTDIDDKTIRGAMAKNVLLKEFTEPYRIAFFEDLDTLNIERAEHYPAATDFIPQMIEIIQRLLDKGTAYESKNGSIYFSIRKFPRYGRLSHLKLEELKLNASGDNEADEYDKDNLSDFVLWKAYDPLRDGKTVWDSPFGKGRPGWHIECSAMAMSILGETIDIHCGGVDNCFPHHENEIAQSEAYSGKPFVRHWMHAEHLLVDHKKMSKSLGNFYTLRDLLNKGYTGQEVRYLLLSNHYRSQLNFTFAGLDGARTVLTRIADFVDRVRRVSTTNTAASLQELLLDANAKFKEALADDLNISVALASLFDLIREINSLIDADKLGVQGASQVLQLLSRWDQVLGVLPLIQKEEAPQALQILLQEREEARKSKNWALSDALRNQIMNAGYLIEDSPQGARLKKAVR
ncbi:MAG TPA: cysteine--tRNA ligase [Chlamydiales bacterium]|jgi:cysteinyl-tRNA synthetase